MNNKINISRSNPILIFSNLLLILLMSFVITANATEDSVKKFESLIKTSTSLTNSITPTYFNKHTTSWAKKYFSISNLKYDVRKTDSLVNPIVGIISFNLHVAQSDFYSTKEEADLSTTLNPKFKTIILVNLTYSFNDKIWLLNNGSYKMNDPDLSKYEYNFTENQIRHNSQEIPYIALINWLQN